MLARAALLLSLAHAAAKNVALFSVKRENELDVYVAVSDEATFAYDAGGLLLSVGCELSGAFDAVEVHPDAKVVRSTGSNAFTIAPVKGRGFPAGWVATVKLPSETARTTVLQYSSKSFAEADGEPPKSLEPKENPPWIILVAGEPTEKKPQEKTLWVFGPAPHIRSFGLGFAKPIKGTVSAAASFTAPRSLEVVSAFTAYQKIAWGVFSPPFLTPTGTPVGRLTFEEFELSLIERTSRDTIIEMEDYHPADTILLVHAPVDLTRGAAAGESSGKKASEWKVDI